MMIKTKYFSSSISVSFASVFLFSALFAACCFTFLYLQPLQQDNGSDDRIHDIRLVNSPPSSNRRTKMDEKLAISPAPMLKVEDLVNPRSPEDEDGGGGLVEELIVKSNDPNLTKMEVENVNSTADPTKMVEDGNQGLTDHKQAVNSDAPKEADGHGEDVESTPASDKDLFTPPFNVSVGERIAWFKERVPRMKVFESTKRTRVFDQRIKEFFKGCKVRFFMTWISPSRLFGKREMFSLESVFKAHPKGCVVIVSKSMDSKRGRDLLKPLVEQGYKVLPVAPDLSLLFSDTRAGPWLEGLKAGQFDPGMIPITQNLSNLLRIVLLHKYGGIYLDADVLVLKDLSGLKNCVGIQTVDERARIWTSLNNAVMIFDQKHPLLLKLIEEFTTHFDGNAWGHNGPYMVSRVVMKVAFNDPAYDFNIMSPTAFYPVDWFRIPKYFRRPKNANETQWTYDEDYQLKQRSYAIHLWNHVSSRLRIEEQSLIGRIISDHCIICKDIYDINPTSTSS
ncbi:hypothetical protein Cgig2_014667 [Carnegiea gigantea]|uniref:Alpha 1,4-glycosyltransferase domain-containing protein n=1 Tax=Carnegiea gigantea TaxID=171969 RepID=A0A9Q1L1R1_9CARY|nr:hypothetical protein Cgig2_014667 [Carnegiea gigantea]